MITDLCSHEPIMLTAICIVAGGVLYAIGLLTGVAFGKRIDRDDHREATPLYDEDGNRLGSHLIAEGPMPLSSYPPYPPYPDPPRYEKR